MLQSIPKKSLSQQPLFEVSLFRFNFVSALYYLDCYYNEYPVKQTTSIFMKLPLKPAFFSMLLLFLDVLNLFISEYLDQIPPWKEIKDALSFQHSKHQTDKN